MPENHILMKTRSLVSIDDLSTEEINRILKLAGEFEKNPVQELLPGKVIATLFFEPSTRTRLSFESAVCKLGGKVIGFTDSSSSSVTKGETLYDTIRMVNNYADLIVMRHPIEGSARYASEISTVPVINAGDGANQHPTQTLLDLYSIYKTQGTLDDLTLLMVGDLKYGRTVHSLLMAMSQFHTTFHFISPLPFVAFSLPSLLEKILAEIFIDFDLLNDEQVGWSCLIVHPHPCVREQHAANFPVIIENLRRVFDG